MSLVEKRCRPCEGGEPPLSEDKIKELIKEVPSWTLKDGHLFRTFKFKDFKGSMRFVNAVADIAEAEGHHPNIAIRYNRVDIELWTHAVGGLSENDFILAAKIEKVISSS